MPRWVTLLIALAAIVILAPPVAWLARRIAPRAKGGLMLASLYFGLGHIFQPQSVHQIEASERKEGPDESGAPPAKD